MQQFYGVNPYTYNQNNSYQMQNFGQNTFGNQGMYYSHNGVGQGFVGTMNLLLSGGMALKSLGSIFSPQQTNQNDSMNNFSPYNMSNSSNNSIFGNSFGNGQFQNYQNYTFQQQNNLMNPFNSNPYGSQGMQQFLF